MELLEKFCRRIDSDNGYDNVKLSEDLEAIAKKHYEQFAISGVVGQSEQLVSFLRQYQKACEIMHVNKIDAKNFVEQYKTN